MKKRELKRSIGLKILAAAAAALCFFAVFAGGVLTVICVQNNVYLEDDNKTFLKNTYHKMSMNDVFESTSVLISLSDEAAAAGFIRYNGTDAAGNDTVVIDQDGMDGYLFSRYPERFQPEQTNCAYCIYGDNHELLYSTLPGYAGGKAEGYTDSDGKQSFVLPITGEDTPFTSEDTVPAYSVSDCESFIYSLQEQAYENKLTGIFYGAVNFIDGRSGYIPLASCAYSDIDVDCVFKENYTNCLAFFDSMNIVWGGGEPVYMDPKTVGVTEAPDSGERETDASLIPGGVVFPSLKFEGKRRETHDVILTVTALVSDNPTERDGFYAAAMAANTIAKYKNAYPAVCAASLLVFIALTVWLICASGWKKTADSPAVCWFDRIPIELFVPVGVACAFGVAMSYYFLVYDIWRTLRYGIRLSLLCASAVIVLATGVFAVLFLMTLATRIKTGTFWKYSILGFIGKLARAVMRSLRPAWKIAVFMVLYSGMFLFIEYLAQYDPEIRAVLMTVCLGALTCGMLIWAEGFTRIRNYVKRIADGELDAKISRDFLFGELRHTADDLERVGDGVKKAVDERMRSERLKTELITNVSHDLKTPLTSIVNYVDILSKDDGIESESAKEHIDVLKRQAAKMKKLIEDLVEASKASSGSVAVNFERTDVNLLLTQSVAEYSERLSAAQLETVARIPEEKMTAMLDGRLMWRVTDNLMNNICKYAMPNTRVYITAEDCGVFIKVSFKNISKCPIDADGEELTERFVRGDRSRNTEGSGLGLSIAKSLCDLQGVGFGVSVDGDLFKAELIIAKAPDELPEGDGSVE